MYNRKDIQFVGKHDYDKSNKAYIYSCDTFSIGIFKWELSSTGKFMKKGKAIVRVCGDSDYPQKVYDEAERIVSLLDTNAYNGKKKRNS